MEVASSGQLMKYIRSNLMEIIIALMMMILRRRVAIIAKKYEATRSASTSNLRLGNLNLMILYQHLFEHGVVRPSDHDHDEMF